MTSKQFDMSALRAKLSEIKTGKSPQSADYLEKFYSPPMWDSSNSARSTIRILPGPQDNPNKFFAETKLYRINNKNLHSPTINGDYDPIHEYIKALWATKQDDKIELARKMKGRKRFYFNVIARERIVQDFEKGGEIIQKNKGPLIFSCGIKLFEKILRTLVDPDYDDPFIDLKEGYDFRIVKEEKEGYPNYDDSNTVKKSTVAGSDKEIKEWMNNLHDLDSLIKIESAEVLKQELETYLEIEGIEEKNNTQYEVSDLNSNSSEKKNSDNSNDDNDNDNDNDNDDDQFMKQLESIQNSG